ncbi:MAG: hypothetical protein M8350_08110 [Methanosarcinaceae archaeon]|nr:hypothetical protein [Methanosarcinaceae archaeon]
MKANMGTNGRNGSPAWNLRILSTGDIGKREGTIVQMIIKDQLFIQKIFAFTYLIPYIKSIWVTIKFILSV